MMNGALVTRKTDSLWKAYPIYKESGIDWLGKIPEHWEAKAIKRMCNVKRGASPRPIDDPMYFDDEGEYAWVRIADVSASERYLNQTEQRLSTLGRSKSVSLSPGDLFISIAGTVGKPIITKIKCCIHDGFVYFVGIKMNKEFLYYLFTAGEAYKGLGKLSTQLNLNTDTIGSIIIGVPSEDEQAAIVDFLDHETAKIDALVKKKEQLIKLLEEKRTALISNAVTKGLDPNTPMKDSGIEWIGKAPKHWEVKRLKHVTRFAYGDSLGAEQRENGDIPVYGSNGIVGDHSASNTKGPCLIVGRKGSYGKVTYSGTPVFAIDTTYFVDSTQTTQNLRWLYYMLSSVGLDQFSEDTGVPGLNREDAYERWLPSTDLSEQQSIADYLDRETTKLDALISKIREHIARLQEYRTSLISAAVTGKIDVRGDAS
jgi:type I restriction enzyme S subunit